MIYLVKELIASYALLLCAKSKNSDIDIFPNYYFYNENNWLFHKCDDNAKS